MVLPERNDFGDFCGEPGERCGIDVGTSVDALALE
jgi:hypothetical protein